METQEDPQKQNPQHVQEYNYEKKKKKICQIYLEANKLWS